MLKQSIEKSFLIDPLNRSNAIYRDSLTLNHLNRSNKMKVLVGNKKYECSITPINQLGATFSYRYH